MQAVDVFKTGTRTFDAERRNRIVDAAFAEGLLLLGCGEGSIRFLPPLNLEKGHVDAAVEVLRRAFATP